MHFSNIKSETQKHAASTRLPYNLNDNPIDNERQWKHLGRTWNDPGAVISYGINSNGYRSPEFDELDWDGSIICIGDSMIFGTGNAECHTIPAILSTISGIPCINLGECNSSNLFIAETCLRLRDLGIRPRGVAVLLTTIYRTTWTTGTGRTNLNPWSHANEEDLEYFSRWCLDDDRVRHQSKHAYDVMRMAWDHIPLSFLCYSADMESVTGVRTISHPQWDLARDGRHFGPDTNSRFAHGFSLDLGIFDTNR